MSDNKLQYLSQEQFAFFNDYGYLRIENVFSQEALDDFQSCIEKWVNRVINKWLKKGLIDRDFSEEPFERRYLLAWRAAKTAPIKDVITPEIAGLEIFNFLQIPEIAQIVHDLIKSTNIIALKAYMCRPTFPNTDWDFDTLWHQDAQCIDEYNLSEDMNFVTLWIPFMDIDEHNSCLQMSPSYHKKGILHPNSNERPPHYSLSEDITNNFESVVAVPAKRGDIVCIHKLTPHNALPNNSDAIRWSIDMRFEGIDEEDPKWHTRGFYIANEDPSKIPNNAKDAFEHLFPKN